MSASENLTRAGESDDSPPVTSTPCAAAPLESILCTEELRRRPARPPDYEKENCALVALVSALADSPRTILQTLADKVLTILDADSAGLSLLTKDKKRFYWAAISGAWRPHIGGGTPREFGPCGDVLDRNIPLLFTHWERRYPYLGAAVPLAEEGLLVPFFVNGKSLGTIWVISHNMDRKFDTEDLRLLESMGRFASAAYQTSESIEDLGLEIAARKKAEQELRKLTDGLEAQVLVRTEKLRQSEARKTAILDSALDCIVTIDHEARITEFNLAAERTFGHRRDEVVGKQLAEVIIPESLREKHRQGFSRYLSTGEEHVLGRRLEMKARRADGSEFPVELAITRIPIEGPPSFTGYLRDITERKQWEEKLRHSEAYLAEAQRLSHTGSFGWKVSSGEITWSEESFRIFEYDLETKPTIELVVKRVHPEDLDFVRQLIGRASQDEKDWELEHRLLMPGGAVKHVHIVARAIGSQSEKFEFVGAIMDVTGHRRSEEALRKARANLAHIARLTTVGELTASIAHEVNQPLAAVVTNANAGLRWLEHEPPNIEEVRIAIQRIVRDANRGSEVIKRIRGLVKKEHPRTAGLDVNEVVRETITLAGLDLQGTALQTELAGELPPVQADRVQLQQVLLNLTINAMEAMKPITDRPHVLRILTKYHEEGAVLVAVEDSGVGLNPEGMEKLFETFYTTKAEGLGMGLSICRSIIEGHGGRLWAEFNEGPGARFQFTLPIERECAA